MLLCPVALGASAAAPTGDLSRRVAILLQCLVLIQKPEREQHFPACDPAVISLPQVKAGFRWSWYVQAGAVGKRSPCCPLQALDGLS